jgi:hypothetical protein
MKPSLICLPFVLILSSCTNTLFVGHDHAYDANLSLSADLTKVLSLNAGFEGRSFCAVPPANPVMPDKLINPTELPEGDLLSTLSALKVQRVTVGGQTNLIGANAAALDFVASTATGDAAEAVANGVKANPAASKTPANATPASAADSITHDAKSIATGQFVPAQ